MTNRLNKLIRLPRLTKTKLLLMLAITAVVVW